MFLHLHSKLSKHEHNKSIAHPPHPRGVYECEIHVTGSSSLCGEVMGSLWVVRFMLVGLCECEVHARGVLWVRGPCKGVFMGARSMLGGLI